MNHRKPTSALTAFRYRLDRLFGFPLLALGVVVIAAQCGGKLFETLLADGASEHFLGWVQTRDASPGDTIAVRVAATNVRAADIGSVRVHLGELDTQVGPVFQPVADQDHHERSFVITIPETTPIGSAMLKLDVDADANVIVTSHTYRGARVAESIKIPIDVVSPSARTLWHALFNVVALLAWVAAGATSYAIARWSRIETPAKNRLAGVTPRYDRLVVIIILLAMVLIAATGELAFIRPIVRTMSSYSDVFRTILHAAWVGALVLGGSLGFKARRTAVSWFRLRVRAVLGTQPQAGYREAASTLPPSLSRRADPRRFEEVAAAFREAGFGVENRRRFLLLSAALARVARVRSRCDSPVPEDLEIEVLDAFDPSRVAAAVAALYGPVEIDARGRASIVEPP